MANGYWLMATALKRKNPYSCIITKLMSYDHLAIEKKWQNYWDKHKTFEVPNRSDKPKYYVLDMFPYPSANGLHVGHLEGYTASDIVARYKRMKGFHVLHPMGWDSFGLPTENYAIQIKRHPADITEENISLFKKQIKSVGFSYDWTREFATSSPDYYRWTQWLFLKFYERNLAYQAEMMVNYCPALSTVLANEEVIDGKSERGGHPVIRVPMKQWVLRITEYADRLLEDLEELDWPEHVKEMQRNWIGKSHGANITFEIEGKSEPLNIFTTRADTLMGVTFMALAAEHPWVTEIIQKEPENSDLRQTVQKILNQSEREREKGMREKLGTLLPLKAIHPVTGEKIPIWVANYVLMSYGTGAIMAVPAHDERDLEFSKAYNLPVTQVINDDNIMINSGSFNGLTADEGRNKIVDQLAKENKGNHEVRYRMRDWIFSRQRYWGEPIPILHFEDGTCRPLEPDELPLELPQVESYEPAGDGQSPLSLINKWVNLTDPETKKPAKRETNTMPQWAGSCWYYLRYLDSKNEKEPWNKDAEKFWMPVDLYIGGVEHATLHLLYARFWHKVFYDCGLVSTKEPFKKLINQGMILGEDNEKMSKSRGNVVNPDDIIEKYGADSIRLYEMFLGPLEMVKPWKTDGITGVNRFLHRLFAIVDKGRHVEVTSEPASKDERTHLHNCIKKVGNDLEHYKFNTAIAEMMSFLNFIYDQKRINKESLETFVKILCPFAPHICEEVWERLGHKTCLSLETWAAYDEKLTAKTQVTIAIQVNGKLRGTLNVDIDTSREEILKMVESDAKLGQWLKHPGHIKTIVVPNKIVNIVLKP